MNNYFKLVNVKELEEEIRYQDQLSASWNVVANDGGSPRARLLDCGSRTCVGRGFIYPLGVVLVGEKEDNFLSLLHFWITAFIQHLGYKNAAKAFLF